MIDCYNLPLGWIAKVYSFRQNSIIIYSFLTNSFLGSDIFANFVQL